MESAAALPWNQRQLSPGISGRLAMESVAAFVWNRWQLCRGIGGRIHLESVAALAWNTHTAASKSALANTTSGDLPPSARDRRFRLPAEACAIVWTVRCEPVNTALVMLPHPVSFQPRGRVVEGSKEQ